MKTKVLLASDDQKLKTEVSKIVSECFPEIEISFSSNKKDSVGILEMGGITILLADYSSQAIGATEVISAAKEKSPVTFRGLICDLSKGLKAVCSSCDVHRIIQKPIKREELRKTISHFIHLQNFQLDTSIITSINELGTTPILPDIYLRLEREMNREDVSIHRVADIISDDPTVAAKILHIIYSSFFGVSNGMINLIQAIHFLGMDIIKHLVLYVKIFTIKNLSQGAQSQLKHLRDHSILVAKVSKAIMNSEIKDREMIDAAYIAGLLHDIGKILIIQFGDQQNKTNGNGTNGKQPSISPKDKSNVSHMEVGTYLLSLWNFTPELIGAVTNHHNAEIINSGEITLDQVVFIANALVNSNSENLKKIEKVYGEQKLIHWAELIPTKLDAA